MKFLLNVLLLISGLFSIIRTGMSLNCFQNNNAEECLDLLEQLYKGRHIMNSSEAEVDRMRQDVISCMKNSHEKLDVITCDIKRKCNTLNVKFQNEDKIMFRFCDKDESGTVCNDAKSLLKNEFEHHLDHASCEYCETDECNADPKDLNKGPSPTITNSGPEVKHNKSSSRSNSSCIHLSVFALFLILGAFFI